MVVFPNAKINLGLDILSKREDGYHNISSCFYPIPFCDILEILPAEKLSFASTGISIPGRDSDNLCLKAYDLLKEDFKIPSVQIYLHKIIPIGAGLGGGSADASFALKCLNDLFELNIEASQLEHYASQIGSDCPFFIENKPVIAEGTGNVFSPVQIDLKGKYLVLLYPDVHIGTAEAYSGVVPSAPERDVKSIIESGVKNWPDQLKNDFEKSIFPKYFAISDLKGQLVDSGANYASMTGSGSAVFGLFNKKPDVDFDYVVWEGILG
ncbi:MAG: 4-(cytidine 5'-diphospho)-2-C-methyl-D-erythritol kinase [Bacteroidota bacterium]